MTWLQVENKAGLPVPWAYIRRELARAWGVPPWQVDEAPWHEVALELRLRDLEAQHTADA